MRKLKSGLLSIVTLTIGALLAAPASAKLQVFACEPEWAALATEVGGDTVEVYQASTALQDPHRIEARPSLVAHMRGADLVVCTGADLEVGWLPVLLQTAGNTRVQPGTPGNFAAADFVAKLEVPTQLDRAAGDIHPGGNPHVHLDPHNLAKVAAALSQRLSEIDAAHAEAYRTRGDDFQQRWQAAIVRWEAEAAPLRGLKYVSYHKDIVYLAHWLGLVELANIEPKPGIPPTTADLATLVGKLQQQPADFITRLGFQDPKPAEWLASRTGTPLLVLPYTVGGTPAATDLFTLFDATLAALQSARR